MTNRHRRRASTGRLANAGDAGFTLIELLVVILIILLVSAVTLPVVIPALANRQVGEAARILQAALAGMRDSAIRANAPRGIRLIPDPVLFTAPTYGATGTLAAPGVLTYSRMIPIEPGPDYTEGKAQIVPDFFVGAPTYYAPYPFRPLNATQVQTYPPGPATFPASGPPSFSGLGGVLRLEECAYDPTSQIPNNPTSWWWNIRVGDKIRIGDSGRYYTVVGPLTIHPFNPASRGLNPELFVNDGNPSNVRTNGNLTRTYPTPSGPTTVGVEFLYLVNGSDDNGDGFIDNGWDGLDNNYQFLADDINQDPTTGFFGEWEIEAWLGSLERYNNPSAPPIFNLSYAISRRPVASPSAREIALPGSIVIDATTWNTTAERSRLPIDPNTYAVDILVDPSGQVISTTNYSSPSSFPMGGSFYHFWLSDRADVFDPGTYLTFPSLPMPSGYLDSLSPFPATYNPLLKSTVLKKDRQLVTLFAKTGQVLINSVENFDVKDENGPFYSSQLGTREAP